MTRYNSKAGPDGYQIQFDTDCKEHYEYVQMAIRDCIDRKALRAQHSSSDTLNGWISVKDRLPVDERQVLTFVGYEDNLIGFITTSCYLCYDENPHWQWDAMLQDGQRTLFWMPLPEPPKEGMQ